jgi:hypothetical protein
VVSHVPLTPDGHVSDKLQPEWVVVHHWSQDGRGELRPFLQKHALAKPGVAVVWIDRQREIIAIQPAADYR